MIFTYCPNDFWHKRKINNFDPYNVFLAIATNIPQRLKTGFVVQGHKYIYIYACMLVGALFVIYMGKKQSNSIMLRCNFKRFFLGNSIEFMSVVALYLPVICFSKII